MRGKGGGFMLGYLKVDKQRIRMMDVGIYGGYPVEGKGHFSFFIANK